MSTSTTIIAAIIISFAVSVILCPIVIPMLKKLKFGQYIREEGPKSHQSKSGTPTMGGMIILASVIVTSLIFMFVCKNTRIVPVLFMVIGFGIIGFLDDYIKVVKKRNLGLTEIQKLVLKLCEEGMSIVFISSEIEEVVRCSNRIVVMRDRKKVAELKGDDLEHDTILKTIAGGAKTNE